jgi:hypothetical protein
VYGQYRLLLDMFNWSKAHRRPCDRLTDCLGIGCVVFACFNVRFNELRSHETDRVPECLQLTRPVMGATACFHADQARRQIGKDLGHLCTLELLLQTCLAVGIHTMNLKNRLCKIDSNCRNLHDDAPLG